MIESSKPSVDWLRWQTTIIAILALLCIATYLILKFSGISERPWPLWITLAVGGTPLVWGLIAKVLQF
ncbi:MAG: hypothetical protein KGS49_18975, partial [Planctomycetes bacterium]|nr:hypothetical protein [Planctomycetota bacterium]